VTLAILGFKRLAEFASVCSPWMFLMFLVGGVVMLPTLGQIGGPADFWRVANEKIWIGRTLDGSAPLGFWHVAAFAWICNLAMHLGLSDMALLRYAKRASYGLYSAFGMYLGHYLAWVCAGIMGAAASSLLNRPLGDIDSGSVAYQALGLVGALAVVIAGWTTSNPTLYRAGLALQVVTPGWPRWLVTLIAGAITTLIACFPFVFTKLLGFVGVYGLLLMPVGAVVVVEHWVFPRIGLTQYWSARKGLSLNWPALLAWAMSLAAAVVCWQTGLIHLFFLCLPVWVLTAVLYIVFAFMAGAREKLPELPGEKKDAAKAPGPSVAEDLGPRSGLYYFAGAVSLACLALCLVLAVLVFAGKMELRLMQWLLIFITAVYFVSGFTWMGQRERRVSAPPG
jgi:cytosine permease